MGRGLVKINRQTHIHPRVNLRCLSTQKVRTAISRRFEFITHPARQHRGRLAGPLHGKPKDTRSSISRRAYLPSTIYSTPNSPRTRVSLPARRPTPFSAASSSGTGKPGNSANIIYHSHLKIRRALARACRWARPSARTSRATCGWRRTRMG